MIGSLTGITKEINRIRKGVQSEVIRPANTAMRRAAMAAIKSYMKNSPVWSGETVRNYKIKVGGPPSGFSSPVGGSVSWPGGPFPDDLRNEARRGANEAVALAAAKAALQSTNQSQTLTQSIFIKNTIPMNKASLIESGAAPTPEKSRYPGGLTPRARQAAVAAAKGLLK